MIILKTRLDSNARLCQAVKERPIIYDRSHENYNKREAYETAWLEISENCGESVSSCKSRWRLLYRSFVKSLKEASQGIRTREYHLRDVLGFLVPHLDITDEQDQPIESGRVSVGRRPKSNPRIDNKSKSQDEIKSEPDSDVEENEKNSDTMKTSGENEKEDMTKGENSNNDGLKNGDIDEKNNESVKTEEKNLDESPITESSQPVGSILNDKTGNIELVYPKQTKSNKIPQPLDKDLSAEVVDPNEATTNKTSQTPKKQLVAEAVNTHETKTNKTPQTPKKILGAEIVNPHETKTNRTPQTPKKNLAAFYISPKNDGTFFIKKKYDEEKDATVRTESSAAKQKLKDKTEPQENSKLNSKTEDIEDLDDDIPLKQISERSLRLQRACKRSFGKTTNDAPADSEKEPEVKRTRRCAERLKSIAKAKQELSKSLELPKQETKRAKSKELEVIRRKRQSLNAPQLVDKVQTEAQQSNSATKMRLPTKLQTKCAGTQTLPAVPPEPTIKKTLMSTKSTQTHGLTPEPKKAETLVVGVQCQLLKSETTDDFLSNLRPYLNDMNARQKLHFKKKIFESLMEVFDSGADFPASKKLKLTETAVAVAPSKAIIPPQLQDTVSGEELSLVRELVAIIQAAKQTPELLLNNNDNNSNSSTDSVTLVNDDEKQGPLMPALTATAPTTKPPPLLRVTPTKIPFKGTSVSRAELPTCLQPRVSAVQQPTASLPSSTPTIKALTTAQAISALQKRRVIRKVVKVNELTEVTTPNSSSTTTTIDGRRRIYRLMPSNGTTPALRNVLSNSAGGSGTGGVQLIPASTNSVTIITPPTTTNVTSAGFVTRPQVIQLTKPRSTDIISDGSENTDSTSTSTIGMRPTSGGAEAAQYVKPRLQRIAPAPAPATQNISGRIQIIQPNKVTSLNQSISTNLRRLFTPETRIDNTSPNNNSSPSPAGAAITTTAPNQINIRRAIVTTTRSTTATSATTTKTITTNYGQIETNAVSTTAWTPLSIASATRPPMRRYSVCGQGITAIERESSPNTVLTTTANDEKLASVNQVSTASRNSQASQPNNALFKLPTLWRSSNSTTVAVTATASTTTTAARGNPLVSASASSSSSSARTMPISVNLNRLQQSTSSSNPNASNSNNELPKGINLRAYYSMNMNLDDDDTRSPNSLLRPTDMEISPADFEGMDFSGIIGSDNFEVVTIKNEPIDFD
ncbi:serine-rich adhesin for platelets isoform X1 [Eurosta solidaginis]|uniref:serine-rich adhesin for platelets isoform X1 n=1 Tax=Eurosta solidaginis TaxID=178769 RepID=UPI00353060EA